MQAPCRLGKSWWREFDKSRGLRLIRRQKSVQRILTISGSNILRNRLSRDRQFGPLGVFGGRQFRWEIGDFLGAEVLQPGFWAEMGSTARERFRLFRRACLAEWLPPPPASGPSPPSRPVRKHHADSPPSHPSAARAFTSPGVHLQQLRQAARPAPARCASGMPAAAQPRVATRHPPGFRQPFSTEIRSNPPADVCHARLKFKPRDEPR